METDSKFAAAVRRALSASLLALLLASTAAVVVADFANNRIQVWRPGR